MRNCRFRVPYLAVIACALWTAYAAALSKYYHPSLEEETASSDAIAVGTVVGVQPLSEDPADPEGWTAFIYRFRVTETLRGTISNEITLRAENDSGGYRMQNGETHLLFLRREKEAYTVDPCGNSVELPRGRTTLKKLKTLLSREKHGA